MSFPEGGAPSLFDTAIALSREGRFAGAGQRFFPVALHTFVVCDLLPDSFQFDGLLHDSPETVTGDTPKPAKTSEIEAFEEELLRATYALHKVTFPSEYMRRIVKEADRKAMRGEVYTVGNLWLQPFHEPCPEAEELIFKYVKEYTYEDMLEASGRVPMDFMKRFRLYKSQLDNSRLL
jgi:5'-deoxynucleotidase YfbR-like HD superfamily hydrolase